MKIGRTRWLVCPILIHKVAVKLGEKGGAKMKCAKVFKSVLIMAIAVGAIFSTCMSFGAEMIQH